MSIPRLVVFIAAALLVGAALAAHPKLLIIIPAASGPYEEALQQIASGIEDAHAGEVASMRISSTSEREIVQLADLLGSIRQPQRVVTLGPLAHKAVDLATADGANNENIERYATGVKTSAPLDNSTTLSFNLAPTTVISWTKRVRPSISKIVVFYPEPSAGLAAEFESAGHESTVEVTQHVVSNALDALRQVRATLSTIDPQHTVIWFLNGALSLHSELLSEQVLEDSWRRNVLVFSDDPAHAQRGFLLSLYPDYYEAGRDLIDISNRSDSNRRRRLHYTRSVRMALNLRTARHLRIDNLDDLKDRADALFPRR